MRNIWLLGVAWCGAACSSAADTGEQAPPISILVSSDTLEAAEGSVLLIGANVLGDGMYRGDANVAIEDAPPGMRALASNASTVDDITSVLLALAVDPGVTDAAYQLTVRASSPGHADVTTPLTVLVEPAGTPVYSLQVKPIEVVQGDTVDALLNITRANFRDSLVTCIVESVPAGVTVELVPAQNTRAITVIRVMAAPGTPAGRHVVGIRGRVAGHADRIVRVPLTVVSSAMPAGEVARNASPPYR